MEIHAAHLGLWLGLFLLTAVLYTACLCVYRLVFHPLAKYPGPLLAKLTDAYMLYHAWKGDRHLEFLRLHERHGPFVRFGPNALSASSAAALKDVYGFRANVRKAEFYDAFVHPAPNTHNCRDKEVHARKRRVLSQAFSDGAIKEMERYMLANVRTFCEGVAGAGTGTQEKGWSEPRSMADWCNWLAMDILGDLCFGKAFHMLERPDNRYAIDLVSVAARSHLLRGTMPLLQKLRLDKLLFPKLAAGRARYMAYSRAQLAERTKLGDDADRRDFFYHLLRARDPHTGQGFSTPELWGESNLLIIAGSDTTSTAMAATLFYLTRAPRALSRAAAEVRAAFDADGGVEAIRQGPRLAGCVYLRACVDEAMRLSPSVPGLLPREVLRGGLVVDGEALPAGVVVGTPHYALHHDGRYFRRPWAFWPERWLVGAASSSSDDNKEEFVSEEEVARAQAAFAPFSIGPRGCIGKGLAYAEMTTALARLLFLYDVRRAEGVVDPGEGGGGRDHRKGELRLVDTFTSWKEGVMVQFRKREV